MDLNEQRYHRFGIGTQMEVSEACRKSRLSLLGSGFLYPVLTGNLSTEWDLDNLL